MTVEDSYEVSMEAIYINTLYIINQPDKSKTHRAMVTKTNTNNVEIWYQRLTHLNKKDIWRLKTMSTGINSLKGHIHNCEPCALNKAHWQPSHRMVDRATLPFHQVHVDLSGGGNSFTSSIRQNKYYILFTDNATQWKHLEVIKKKSKTAFYMKKFVRMIKNQFSTSIGIFCNTVGKFWKDQGGEFDNDELDEFYTEEGIMWESRVPYVHEQNSTAKQANWTIQEKARTALIDAGLLNTL